MPGIVFNSKTKGLLAMMSIIAIAPLFFTNAYYYDVAINAGINAIVVVGLNLLIGYAGQISLGHAGFFGLGAYISGILTANHDWPPLAAMLVGIITAGLLAFLVARPILKLKGHYLAMATLGLGIIISIVLNQESDLTGGPDGMPVPSLSVLGWELYGEQVWYWFIGGVLLCVVLLALNLVDSPMGRALRAVHGSEIAAQVAGVDTTRYKVLVFTLSAVIAAMAGSLFAHYIGFITPSEASFIKSIEFVTMVVLGGMASTFGAVVGAVLLTILPQFLAGFEDYEMMVFGLILMLTMIFMPKGLVPTLLQRFKRQS